MPIYGVMVPFHILTIKNATNNQARFLHQTPTCAFRPLEGVRGSQRGQSRHGLLCIMVSACIGTRALERTVCRRPLPARQLNSR